MKKKLTLFFIAHAITFSIIAQENKKTKPLTWQDLPTWEFIQSNRTSNNGQWIAYIAGPLQGDLKLTLKSTLDTSKFDFPIGGSVSHLQFNENSQFLGFFENPNFKEIKANQKAKRPSTKKLKVVSLKDTASIVFEKVQSFEFSNENSNWLAIRFDGLGGPPNPEAGKGSDLLLYNLTNKKSFNLGNVADYKFNKSGQYLAFIVDANGKNGNGIFLMNLETGLISSLNNDKANFSKITWNKEGTAFALLKSKKEKDYKSPVYTILGIKNLQKPTPDMFTYSGLDENQIMSGFGISEHTIPYWSKDLNTIFFGISKLEKEETKKDIEKKIDNISKDTTQNIVKKDTTIQDSTKKSVIAKEAPKAPAKPEVNKKDLEKPDMIIWNWQDKRLQAAQRLQLQRDKNYNAMSSWSVSNNKFISLADSSIKSIALSPNQLVGYGLDVTPYDYQSNLDGQRFADVYLIDINTGSKKLILKKYYQNASYGITFSPNSDHLLFYEDGNYFILNLKTLHKTNLTEKIPTSFVNKFIDNNVVKPATGHYGFSADGKYVLLEDNNDLWKVSIDGKSFQSLTKNWKNEGLTTSFINYIYPDDDFIDLKKDQYFNILNYNTKEKGIALLPANSNEIKILKLEEANFGRLNKAKSADKYFYTKDKSNVAPELFLNNNKLLNNDQKLTNNPANNNDWAVSSGSKLITYVSDHGDTLQATLYLPANYEEGKSYPTITYIYERLTDEKNNYSSPGFPGGGFNRFMYNSNGYAVLMPDIKYKLNDPGMSAVACVVPAVKAAIATGIVDEKNVAIHGHSWGGYQTSFLITQTNIFKAAVAGAPLTNMISMYSLIYWNSGSANQSIFESSQGRLTSGYWDNWEAYVRNSPIYHIKKVNTPLIIMHNDKDGAVDYTQGIEYFNSLRRLNKPVVMLSYNGENHGLMKEVNRKDYAVRMMEYFDHYLKGKDAPDWWSKGIDYIDLEKHLEKRAF